MDEVHIVEMGRLHFEGTGTGSIVMYADGSSFLSRFFSPRGFAISGSIVLGERFVSCR